MSLDKIIILISSVGLIGFIYWFFLSRRPDDSPMVTTAAISVSGGYSPSVTKVPVGQPVTLTFTLTDPNPCLEELIIPDLKIKKDLPLNTPLALTLTLTRPGVYPFHCGMNMYHGKIIAV